MALLTALLQGANPAERKVSVPSGGWTAGVGGGGVEPAQELVGTALQPGTAGGLLVVGLNHLSPLPTYLSTCLATCGRETFASSSIR